MSYNSILLAVLQTPRTQGVESTTLNLCHDGTFLHHLLVLPESWKDHFEAEGLNHMAEQLRAGAPLEGKLEQDIQENILRVKNLAEAKNINYSFELMLGEITECMVKTAESYRFDLAILGTPYPQEASNMALQINNPALLRFLPIPLLVIPYPEEMPLALVDEIVG